MKKIFQLGSIASLLILVFLFQNCGAGLNSSVVSDSTNIPIVPTIPNITDPSQFKAGDSLVREAVPFTLDQDFEEVFLDYLTQPDYKALVFAESGVYFSIYFAQAPSQESVTRTALERCELNTKLRCSVLAEGDLIKYDRSVFFTSFHYPIVNRVSFDTNSVPGISFNSVQWNEYYVAQDQSPFKAFSITTNGASAIGYSQVSQAEADRRSLEICDARYPHPCSLYASNLAVVFNNRASEFGHVLDFSPIAVDPEEIPFIEDILRPEFESHLLALSQDGFGAIALNIYGQQITQTSQQPLSSNDLNALVQACESQIATPSAINGCFLYSVNGVVVLNEGDIRPR